MHGKKKSGTGCVVDVRARRETNFTLGRPGSVAQLDGIVSARFAVLVCLGRSNGSRLLLHDKMRRKHWVRQIPGFMSEGHSRSSLFQHYLIMLLAVTVSLISWPSSSSSASSSRLLRYSACPSLPSHNCLYFSTFQYPLSGMN